MRRKPRMVVCLQKFPYRLEWPCRSEVVLMYYCIQFKRSHCQGGHKNFIRSYSIKSQSNCENVTPKEIRKKCDHLVALHIGELEQMYPSK